MAPSRRRQLVKEAILALRGYYGFSVVPWQLILAQAILETGHFTSNLVVQHNNAFGMMHPTQRPNTSDGATSSGFATYSDLFQSVQDYFLRQRYFNIPNTSNVQQYMDATRQSDYFTQPDYLDRWMAVYQDVMDGVPPPADPPGSDLADVVRTDPGSGALPGAAGGAGQVDTQGTGITMGIILLGIGLALFANR